MKRAACWFVYTALVSLIVPVVGAAGIDGTIIIKRKLTKRKVTLESETYRRGTPVELRGEFPEDAVAFEKEHVAIYLEGHLPPRPPTDAPIPVMDQKNRTFAPDLLVVPIGSTVSFPNLDPIFHNVFSLSRPKNFDLGNYSINQTRMVTFSKAGVVMVNCHLHPNMTGTIVVSPTGWAARADGDGHFSLPSVPPGRYTVVAWHKAAGFFRHDVQVTDGRDTNVEFLIPLEAAGEEAHNDVHAAGHDVAHR